MDQNPSSLAQDGAYTIDIGAAWSFNDFYELPPLAEYVVKGKANFPANEDDDRSRLN
jgi:hypothetical protein